MRGFSKLGITLTSVFSLLLLALFAELLYLLFRRRRSCRRRARVEPTGPGPTRHQPVMGLGLGSGSDPQLLKLDGLELGLYGPHSRALFTINEEEAETETTLGEHVGESPPLEVVVVVGGSDYEADPPFLTPCGSPPYYTPSSSPSRSGGGGGGGGGGGR